MRKVLFQRYEKSEKQAGSLVWSAFVYEGLFHKWAIQHEDHGEHGPAHSTMAIVELSDGSIEEVYPTRMKFIEPAK